MKINPTTARKAMDKRLLTVKAVADHLKLKEKSTGAILRGEAGTGRANIYKLCELFKVSFDSMKPEEAKS